MPDEDREGPSLELPSWGLRRRRRRERAEEPSAEPDTPSPPPAPTAAATRPLYADGRVDPETADRSRRNDVGTRPAAAPVLGAPVDQPVDRPVDQPVEAPVNQPDPQPAATSEPAARRRRTTALTGLSGLAAATVTGLLVGLVGVGLTWLALRGCEMARGTSSCGRPGFLGLVAIVVAMVLVGALALRLLRVPDAGSTSFLAVGLLAVLVLLFFVGAVFTWWMVLVVPALSMTTFGLAHWVTTTFVDPP